MAKLLEIVTHPNPILKRISTDVDIEEFKNKDFQKLVKDMTLTMLKKDGVGLAAPQIGKNIRLIIIKTKDENLVMINPVILKKSWIKETSEEGCLSLPGVFCDIKRPKNVTCEYLNIKMEKISLEAKGFLARVIQHEIDHLDGILTLDRANMQK